MEETFYKRVSVKEELPETPRTKHFTNAGYTTFFNLKEGWSDKSVEWWLKPLPILSREKMIEEYAQKFIETKYYPDYQAKGTCEEIEEEKDCIKRYLLTPFADAILKSGLPEKKDIEEPCPVCGSKPSIYQCECKYRDNF